MIKKILDYLNRLLNKLYGKNECFYINSTNVLPPPLDSDEERELLLKVQENDLEARNLLIVHNLRLVVFIAKKFENTRISIEDLISIGSMGLIKAVQTFKLDKNIKLATYASRCIENEILMYLRKTHRMRQEISLDEVLSVDQEGNEMMLFDVLCDTTPLQLQKLTEIEDIENLYYAVNHLSKRERQIIIMRFGLNGEEELTQKEVADILGISQSYISRLEKKILEKMKNIIEIKVAWWIKNKKSPHN